MVANLLGLLEGVQKVPGHPGVLFKHFLFQCYAVDDGEEAVPLKVSPYLFLGVR